MDPVPRVPHPLAPGSQTVCYFPWLKVSVALRSVRAFPRAPEAWRLLRQHIPWLLAEQSRLQGHMVQLGVRNVAKIPLAGDNRTVNNA